MASGRGARILARRRGRALAGAVTGRGRVLRGVRVRAVGARRRGVRTLRHRSGRSLGRGDEGREPVEEVHAGLPVHRHRGVARLDPEERLERFRGGVETTASPPTLRHLDRSHGVASDEQLEGEGHDAAVDHTSDLLPHHVELFAHRDRPLAENFLDERAETLRRRVRRDEPQIAAVGDRRMTLPVDVLREVACRRLDLRDVRGRRRPTEHPPRIDGELRRNEVRHLGRDNGDVLRQSEVVHLDERGRLNDGEDPFDQGLLVVLEGRGEIVPPLPLGEHHALAVEVPEDQSALPITLILSVARGGRVRGPLDPLRRPLEAVRDLVDGALARPCAERVVLPQHDLREEADRKSSPDLLLEILTVSVPRHEEHAVELAVRGHRSLLASRLEVRNVDAGHEERDDVDGHPSTLDDDLRLPARRGIGVPVRLLGGPGDRHDGRSLGVRLTVEPVADRGTALGVVLAGEGAAREHLHAILHAVRDDDVLVEDERRSRTGAFRRWRGSESQAHEGRDEGTGRIERTGFCAEHVASRPVDRFSLPDSGFEAQTGPSTLSIFLYFVKIH